MTVPVLGVHGVTVVGPYAETWQRALEEGAGVTVDVTEAVWPSTGGFREDVMRLIAQPSFRRRAVSAVARAVEAFALTYRDGVLVGHSMGQPLLFAALRDLARDGVVVDLPIVTIGGPAFHRLWGAPLRVAGLGLPPPGSSVAHYWNEDDPVCGRWPVHPSWVTHERVAVAGRAGAEEHHAHLYLVNPVVARAVVEARWVRRP